MDTQQKISHEIAAAALRVTRQTIYAMLADGRLSSPLTAQSVIDYINAERAKLDTSERTLKLLIETV